MSNTENTFHVDVPQPLTWGATPLQVYGRDDIKEQQQVVYRSIQERTLESLPRTLPKELKEFILVSVVQRFHQESMHNYESHERRLNKNPLEANSSLEFLGMYDRAKSGHATPSELLQIRRELGMYSVELGKLSHPYGQEIQQLVPMRRAVRAAITDQGGILYPDDSEHRKLKLLNGDAFINQRSKHSLRGIAMRRKRWVGDVDDDTRVYERSNFVVRTDGRSKLGKSVLDQLRSLETINNPTWSEDVFAIDGLEEAVYEGLESDRYEATIPLSTVVYAYNLTAEKAIEQQEAFARANRLPSKREQRIRQLAQESMDSTKIAFFRSHT